VAQERLADDDVLRVLLRLVSKFGSMRLKLGSCRRCVDEELADRLDVRLLVLESTVGYRFGRRR
jgi:hypothetical protein